MTFTWCLRVFGDYRWSKLYSNNSTDVIHEFPSSHPCHWKLSRHISMGNFIFSALVFGTFPPVPEFTQLWSYIFHPLPRNKSLARLPSSYQTSRPKKGLFSKRVRYSVINRRTTKIFSNLFNIKCIYIKLPFERYQQLVFFREGIRSIPIRVTLGCSWQWPPLLIRTKCLSRLKRWFSLPLLSYDFLWPPCIINIKQFQLQPSRHLFTFIHLPNQVSLSSCPNILELTFCSLCSMYRRL